jgi:heat shock protein HtpX
MNLGKRFFLFIAVNLLIVLTITTVLNLFGVQPYLTSNGIDLPALMLFCTIWGFGGAFISLALSRMMAKWMMGVRLNSQDTRHSDERWVLETVNRLASQSGLPQCPEVGIYESPDPNAFATGPTKSRALVAVSTGLLRTMNRTEIEGVLAHEVAHIANGDMVTMTLVQGVVNAFVMFFARILAWFASQFVDEDKRSIVNFIAVLLFEIAFSILGMILVAAFSRHREFRADAGAASLAGKDKMIAALKSLQNFSARQPDAPAGIATLQISSRPGGSLLALISTHPPLEVRIARLQQTYRS